MLSELFILFTPSTCSYIKEFKKWESLEFSVGNREVVLFYQDLKMAI